MSVDIIRHQILRSMRDYLYQKGYMEVFSSIIRNSDSKINPRFKLVNGNFLRDCMELSLRKKVSVVCPKVFEIGPCFRQDKEDDVHQKEFYLMELYSKDEKLQNMVGLMRGIIIACIPTVQDIKEISIRDFILSDLDLDIAVEDTSNLTEMIVEKYAQIERSEYPHLIVNQYIELFIEPSLTNNDCLYFLIDYPLCTIAVASRKDKTNCIQRFECYISGMEIANAFEDCMDIDDLSLRLYQSGVILNEEEELIELVRNKQIASTVGLGIGIDRLCKLFSL